MRATDLPLTNWHDDKGSVSGNALPVSDGSFPTKTVVIIRDKAGAAELLTHGPAPFPELRLCRLRLSRRNNVRSFSKH